MRFFWLFCFLFLLGIGSAQAQNPGQLVWPGTAAVTNYGTAPTGTVPAVNAFITGGATGSSFIDSNPFTSGSSTITVNGCVYWTSIPSLANGEGGACAQTINRNILIDGLSGSNIISAINAPPAQAVNITQTLGTVVMTSANTAYTLLPASSTTHIVWIMNSSCTQPMAISWLGTASLTPGTNGSIMLPPATNCSTYANAGSMQLPLGVNSALSAIAPDAAHPYVLSSN